MPVINNYSPAIRMILPTTICSLFPATPWHTKLRYLRYFNLEHIYNNPGVKPQDLTDTYRIEKCTTIWQKRSRQCGRGNSIDSPASVALKKTLESESVWRLIRRFAVPAIISGLVNSLYNIVDQIFIGQSVGPLGNAATYVAFPLVIMLTALAMMIGVGSTSQFSLWL